MSICASQVFLCPAPVSNLPFCSSSTVASLLYLTLSGPSLSFSALSQSLWIVQFALLATCLEFPLNYS